MVPIDSLICVVLLVCLCTGSGEGSSKHSEESTESGDDLSKYLYKTAEEKHFVDEFTGDAESRPDFVYSPNYANRRLVLYYAHWCPHCRHFKPKYIELSNQIHEMSEKFHTTVETFAISCTPQAQICSDNDIHGYPTVMFYPPHSINGTKVPYNALNAEGVFQLAGISTQKVDKKADTVIQHRISEKHAKDNNIPPKSYFMDRSSAEAFHDAHISFDFAMKTAIFTQTGPLPENPKIALQEFLFAMKKTLPLTSSMQPVVADLLKNFESVTKSSESFNKILAKHPPPTPINKWSQASLQHGTGYTAGLWLLFHVMSVGLVQWNHITIDDDQKLIPAAMADILRNYVEHFFQCEECRLHFLSEFDACMYDRCNRLSTTARGGTVKEFIQYPLWLYETHNAVNARLRKERVEENIEKEGSTTQSDVMWPPYESCTSCWLSTHKDSWDEIEVYKFLEMSYWPGDQESEVSRVLSNDTTENELINPIQQDFIRGEDNEINFFSTGLFFCLSSVAIFVWYRKRRYKQRGMHKKN